MTIEVKTDSFGTTRHFLDGVLHREEGPAVICRNGILEYRQFGVLHRVGGPAMIYPRDGVPGDVDEYWYFLGELHRDDGPAVISKDEHMMWYQHGKLHRTDGPAIVSHLTGSEHWYKDGERHRPDGPAVTLRTGEIKYFWYGLEYPELPKEEGCMMERKIIETEVKRRPDIMVDLEVLAAVIERVTNLCSEDCMYVAIRIDGGERWLPGPKLLRPEFQDLTKVSDLTWYCTVVPHFEEIYDESVRWRISEADLKTLINDASMGDSLSMVKLAGMLIRGELKITQV